MSCLADECDEGVDGGRLYNPADDEDLRSADRYPTGLEDLGEPADGACIVCGSPLEGSYCATCSVNRAAVEPFYLGLADDDEEPATERNPAPPDFGSIEAKLLKAGCVTSIVAPLIEAGRRAVVLGTIGREGIPVADSPLKSGVEFDRKGLRWMIYAGDQGLSMTDVELLFQRACAIVEGCGYVLARRSKNELWADVYEPIARGAA